MLYFGHFEARKVPETYSVVFSFTLENIIQSHFNKNDWLDPSRHCQNSWCRSLPVWQLQDSITTSVYSRATWACWSYNLNFIWEITSIFISFVKRLENDISMTEALENNYVSQQTACLIAQTVIDRTLWQNMVLLCEYWTQKDSDALNCSTKKVPYLRPISRFSQRIIMAFTNASRKGRSGIENKTS